LPVMNHDTTAPALGKKQDNLIFNVTNITN
jgi:hypothetical protein